jgi:putative restriction endonuclease
MRGFVAVTDPHWLEVLAAGGAREVNFWQPRPTPVRNPLWTPWLFKVRGSDRIAGFGFFSYWTVMPLAVAWETFGTSNGVRSYGEMVRTVERLRRGVVDDDRVGCVVLSDVTLLAPDDVVAAPSDWHKNIVRGASYDLETGEGFRMWSQLQVLSAEREDAAGLVSARGGRAQPSLIRARRGQGAFRLMVMDAYEKRCAVTGERTLPVLEAAHIRPFAEHETHEVRNGILMRSDVHRLFDRGLVTVLPDLTFKVSRAIERDYSNGKIYYALDGKPIALPSSEAARPDREALAWHASEVFRP